MYFLEDEMLAESLQSEFDKDAFPHHKIKQYEKENLNDSVLELLDPTPNIHALFVSFDKRFFWNTLGMVEVKWSHRMTVCAGICYYQGKRGLCSISLSAPLLSLRPRKDLVETLLHEMIHAYLFVTENNKDRDGHGPEFHKHMHRINKEAGVNITVYHTFHDEVEYHQRHIWRCDGPCQSKKPFFGIVRRASNRAPGPNDFWWEKHKKECGGNFIKISEPEKPEKSKSKKEPNKDKTGSNLKGVKDIRTFFPPRGSSTSGSSSNHSISNVPGTSKTSNVVTFKDLIDKKGQFGTSGTVMNKGSGTFVVTQKNHDKNKSNQTETVSYKTEKADDKTRSKENNKKYDQKSDGNFCRSKSSGDVNETVRNIWSKKFADNNAVIKEKPKTEIDLKIPDPKRREVDCPICGSGFSESEIAQHVENCSAVVEKPKTKIKVEIPDSKTREVDCPVCGFSYSESEIARHVDQCLSQNENSAADDKNSSKSENEVENVSENNSTVDCLGCNKKVKQRDLEDHLEICLSSAFENEKDDFDDDNDDNEINCESVPCPSCMKWVLEKEMDTHLDECLTLTALKSGLLDDF